MRPPVLPTIASAGHSHAVHFVQLRCQEEILAVDRPLYQIGLGEAQESPPINDLWQAIGATVQGEASRQQDSIPAPREDRNSITKYGANHHKICHIFIDLSSPYYFGAVRSFGECEVERGEIRPFRRFRSQELRAKKPSNTGDFRRSNLGKRDLPKG